MKGPGAMARTASAGVCVMRKSAIVAALIAVLGASPGAAQESAAPVLIENVTLISPERARPRPGADVLIRDGRIARIGSNIRVGRDARRIDGRGRYLIPGLIDGHVHIGNPVGLDDSALETQPELLADYQRQLPRSYLAFGFTTIVDVDLRPQTGTWFEQAPLHPRLLHCGRAVRTAGGYGAMRVRPEAPPNLIHEPSQADHWPSALDPADWSVEHAVERIAASGGVCVKAFVEPGFGGTFNWPAPSPETLASLRAAARKRGLPLLVHANSVDAWRAALDANADMIAHGLWYWPGDMNDSQPSAQARAAVEAAARSGIGVQPTLQVLYGQQSLFDPVILDDPRFSAAMPASVVAYLRSDAGQAARRALAAEYEQAAHDIQALTAAFAERARLTLGLMEMSGVRLLFGSDTPAGDGFGNPPGFNGRLELQRWSDAGVPPGHILRAATIENARAFGLDAEIGSIETGKRADLLLLTANPLTGVDAFDTIELVILNGEPIARNALTAPP